MGAWVLGLLLRPQAVPEGALEAGGGREVAVVVVGDVVRASRGGDGAQALSAHCWMLASWEWR